MLHTNDLYNIINSNLIIKGFTDIKDVPVETLKEEIRRYLMLKLYEHDESLGIDILFHRFESYIDEKDKPKILGNFIHYALSYISLIQSFEVIWFIEDDIKESIFKESEYVPGKIDGLVTNKRINYLETLNFCLEEARLLKEEGRGRH